MSRISTAQNYPTRPVTLIVPWPAGGPSDTIARIIAERTGTVLGQPIIVENVTGARAALAWVVSPARQAMAIRSAWAAGPLTSSMVLS